MNIHDLNGRTLSELSGFVEPSRIKETATSLGQLRHSLQGRRIVNITGDDRSKGGVFEILRALLPYLVGAGIEVDWYDVSTATEARSALEFLHVLGHGVEPSTTWVDDLVSYRRSLESFSRTGSEEIQAELRSDDVVLLHDTQTALLASTLSRTNSVVWHAHIGATTLSPPLKAYWDLLGPSLAQASACIFYLDAYIPPHLRESSRISPPGVDPSTAKSAPLALDEARSCLTRDLLTSSIVDRLAGRAAGLGRASSLAVQVSRWDPLKDMTGTLQLFADVATTEERFHGLLLGTAAESASEMTQLEACIALHRTLAPEIGKRLHVWTVRESGSRAHDQVVRVVQAAADIVVQKSLQEGFGLTVTEAMLRGKAVLGSAVGGIPDQIRNDYSGLLVDQPFGPSEGYEPLRRLLSQKTRSTLGAAARSHALDVGCIDRQLLVLCRILADVADPAA